MLHATRSVQRAVGRRERGHNFIADGLDDRALIQLGRRPHDFHTVEDHVASASVTHHFINAGAADNIGEQYGEFYVFSHTATFSTRVRRARLRG